VVLLQSPQLMRFQQKERRFHSGKKRGAEDQNRDGSQHND
jgi:hypothetical protein